MSQFIAVALVLTISIYFHSNLIEEGRTGRPKMMTVSLHCRIVGRPGRASGLADFMDHAKSLGSDVWICTREDIARYWYDKHYPVGQGTPIGTQAVQSKSQKLQREKKAEISTWGSWFG